MEHFGLNMGYVLVQICNVGFLGWPVISIFALWSLRKRKLPPSAKAVWALIVLIPYLGALAYWLVNPAENSSLKEER